jgi:uncharacterized membrane protein
MKLERRNTTKPPFSDSIYLGVVAALILTMLGFVVNNITQPRITKSDEGSTYYTVKVLDTAEIKCPDYVISEDTKCKEFTFKDPITDKTQSSILTSDVYVANFDDFSKGKIIRIHTYKDFEGETQFQFYQYDRLLAYYIAFATLITITVLITGKRGVKAIVSLTVSVFTLYYVIIPLTNHGIDPMLVASVVGMTMFAILIYITNGINKLSNISILGASIAILSSIIAAYIFSGLTNISGYGDEIAGSLSAYSDSVINIRGVVMASFILGVLGVVDDATVSQVYTVNEILKNNPKIGHQELLRSSMKVGSSHIGSLMNTLFIAYAASAFPLILLLSGQDIPMLDLINDDIFAEEILRTIVGSIGLIISIPATTIIAVLVLKERH